MGNTFPYISEYFRPHIGSKNRTHCYSDIYKALATGAGYANNFAWGTLSIGAGNSLALQDGNEVAGGALYVGQILGACSPAGG